MITCPLASAFCVLYWWMPGCICYTNAKKPHVTMETISWAVYTTVLQSPLEEICVHPVPLSAQFMCVVYASVNVHVWERRWRERGREWVSLCFLSSSIITPWQLIPQHSALTCPVFDHQCANPASVIHADCMQLSAVVYIRHMLSQTAGHAFPSHYSPTVHSYYSVTERPQWPRRIRQKMSRSHVSLSTQTHNVMYS